MSTRRLTLDLPVSVFRQLSAQAKLSNKSMEEVAAEAIASNLSFSSQPIRRDEVLAIVAAHRDKLREMGVKSLELFGSVARDEATLDSDVDFLVEFDRPIGWEFFEVQHYLEEILNCPVDLGSQDTLREHLRAPVLKDVIRAI